MNANKARNLLKKFLDQNKIPYERLKAKTIDFTDLARATPIFVTIYGWVPSEPNYNLVSAFAKENGFYTSQRMNA